jgi:hypothetical protein
MGRRKAAGQDATAIGRLELASRSVRLLQPGHEVVGDIMRTVEEIQPMTLVGGDLRRELRGGGGAKLVLRAWPKRLDDDAALPILPTAVNRPA